MSKEKVDDASIEFEGESNGTELTVGDSTVKLDSEGNVISAEAYGNVLESVDGGMKITRPDGSVMVVDENGGLTIHNLSPKTVGIQNLAEILSYVVREENQSRIHHIDFINGGHVEVIYAPNGKLASCSGNNITQTISKDNEILYGSGDLSSDIVTH